jgi:hypothetical protein
MGTDARALLPTDLLFLAAQGTSYENEAWPRERLGTQETQPALSVLRDQLLALGKRRGAWVATHRQMLQALVGTRRRNGRQAWEIDYLIDCGGGVNALCEVLTRAAKAAGQAGAEKLFVRLEAHSSLMQSLREVAFLAYQRETLYGHPGGVSGGMMVKTPVVRHATPADSYPLYRLYNATTPEASRRYEAATYSEWQASRERQWLRNGVELVSEENGALQASVLAARFSHGVMLDVTMAAGASTDAPSLVAAGARAIDAGNAPLLVTVPSTNESLAHQLEGAGFTAKGEYVSLMHRTTRPLEMPRMLPAVAKNAIGA